MEAGEAEVEEINLRPLEPPRSTKFCFMCMYGGSANPAAKDLIQGIRIIIYEGVGTRSIYDVCRDVQTYYEDKIRENVEGKPKWTRASIKRHILETETDLTTAQKLDLRTIIQGMQFLRDNIVDDTTNQIHLPNLNSYLKLSSQLHKLTGSANKK